MKDKCNKQDRKFIIVNSSKCDTNDDRVHQDTEFQNKSTDVTNSLIILQETSRVNMTIFMDAMMIMYMLCLYLTLHSLFTHFSFSELSSGQILFCDIVQIGQRSQFDNLKSKRGQQAKQTAKCVIRVPAFTDTFTIKTFQRLRKHMNEGSSNDDTRSKEFTSSQNPISYRAFLMRTNAVKNDGTQDT